ASVRSAGLVLLPTASGGDGAGRCRRLPAPERIGQRRGARGRARAVSGRLHGLARVAGNNPSMAHPVDGAARARQVRAHGVTSRGHLGDTLVNRFACLARSIQLENTMLSAAAYIEFLGSNLEG